MLQIMLQMMFFFLSFFCSFLISLSHMIDVGSIILKCDWEASLSANDSITALILPFNKYVPSYLT